MSTPKYVSMTRFLTSPVATLPSPSVSRAYKCNFVCMIYRQLLMLLLFIFIGAALPLVIVNFAAAANVEGGSDNVMM